MAAKEEFKWKWPSEAQCLLYVSSGFNSTEKVFLPAAHTAHLSMLHGY